jgi:glycosyltransferase involved in cell wall biosynthesis
MSGDALITIILPTFRRPNMLPKAIESVLNQDFRQLEMRIYDNCSNDQTPDVVAYYAKQDPRVTYHCHSKNIGAAANYNYALSEIRTPFFSFLADDDWLLPSFCSSALATFAAFPAAQFAVGRTVFDSAGASTPSDSARYRPGLYSQPDGMLNLLKNRFPPWIGILFRTEALREIGAYVTEADGIDWGFLLRASHLEFAAFASDVAVFRRHSGSSCERLPLKMVWPSHMNAASAFLESPRTKNIPHAVLTPVLYRYVSWIVQVACTSALRNHEYDDAEQAASILKNHFRKMAQGSLFTITTALMRRSTLVEYLVDTMFRYKSRGGGLVRRLRR